MGKREIELTKEEIATREKQLPGLVEDWQGAVADAKASAKRHREHVAETREIMERTAQEIESGVRIEEFEGPDEDPRQTKMFGDAPPAEVALPPQAPPAAEHTEAKKRGRKPKQEGARP